MIEQLSDSAPTSLIIASRNRQQFLLESVQSVLAGARVPTELLIIDQSDEPHSALAGMKTDRQCDLRYVWSKTVGLSRANNEGIARARFDLLAFTHDDVIVTSNWFEELVRALIRVGPRSVVTGQVRPSQAEKPGGFAPSTRTGDSPSVYSGRIGQDVLVPINMAMYRTAIGQVGGFDERLGPGTPFPGAEDNDLAFRLLESGFQIVYVPEAIVYHRAWRTSRDYLPIKWNYGLAQGAFYAKHASLRDRYILERARQDLWRHLRRLPSRVRWHEAQNGLAELVYAFGIISGATLWLLNRRGTR